MLRKSMIDLGSLRANEHTETFMQTVSERFSRNNESESRIRLRPGDASWEKIL
jgi:hypothetical protein